jgi:cyclomaltodextrinase
LLLPRADFTPEWSKGVAWYQIFVERFSNGDPTNDPIVTDQEGAYPFDTASDFQDPSLDQRLV